MHRLFADTFYWVALLVRTDQWHTRVTALNRTLTREDVLYTTDAVILELLATLSTMGAYLRQEAVVRVEGLLSNPFIHVAEVPRDRLLDGLRLYKNRPDKAYRDLQEGNCDIRQ